MVFSVTWTRSRPLPPKCDICPTFLVFLRHPLCSVMSVLFILFMIITSVILYSYYNCISDLMLWKGILNEEANHEAIP